MELNDIFSKIFELLGRSGTFSEDLFQEGLYTSLGIINLLISLLIVLSFYFFINKPKFNTLRHWFYFLLGNFALCFIISFIYPKSVFTGLNLEYQIIEYLVFALKSAIISTLMFIIWTYIWKWRKSHCQGTPKLFGKF
ncbi:hypothetical protein [Kordia jejudonensis]|uniref:hypothetical protein n=1 Tax=Kordia jejudonensis TaxID=1348245 RepID=UPI000629C26B|nr:hypothetical protein [Kordia jejudonensis]